MTIAVLAKLQVHPDKTVEFEKAFFLFQQQVNALETNTLLFQLHKSLDNNGAYTVIEQYSDNEAFEAHKTTDHYKAIPDTFGDMMSAPPEIETLNTVF